jgi:hypothetical protein
VSFQKAIPTAETTAGSEAYSVSELLFVDTSGATDPTTHKPYQFSYGEIVFNTLAQPTSCGAPKVDAPTGGIVIDCAMVAGGTFATYFTLESAAGFQTSTWTELTTFRYSVSATQFRAALSAAKMSMPSATFSAKAEDYSLAEWHANELNDYEKGRARLGATTVGVTIELQ